MAISKVILNGVTQMDVTSKTVDATNLLSGYTATKNDGTQITGNATSSTLSVVSITTSTQSDTLSFNGFTSVPSFLIIVPYSSTEKLSTRTASMIFVYSPNLTISGVSNCWVVERNRSNYVLYIQSSPSCRNNNLYIVSSATYGFQPATYLMYYIP